MPTRIALPLLAEGLLREAILNGHFTPSKGDGPNGKAPKEHAFDGSRFFWGFVPELLAAANNLSLPGGGG
jgi:hypothetical protein